MKLRIKNKNKMAYSTGMMKYRVQVAKRATDEITTFGKSGQPKYEILGTFWMGETFNKGVKAMHEGALDAYDTVMFRCRYNANIDRWCLLRFKGKWYQIISFNEDYQENQLQMTAVELANQQVNIVEPTPTPTPTPEPTPDPEPTPEPTPTPTHDPEPAANDNENESE